MISTVGNFVLCGYQDEKLTSMSSLQVWLWTTSSRTISKRTLGCDPKPERSVCWSLMENPRTMSSSTLRACVIRALSSTPSVSANESRLFVCKNSLYEVAFSFCTHQSAYNYCLRDCSLGVKNADENELRSIATDPDTIHMYNVADFSFLLEIVDSLTDNLCNSVKGPGVYEFPAKYAHQSTGITENQWPDCKDRHLLLCKK